jgi:hypothetical protein
MRQCSRLVPNGTLRAKLGAITFFGPNCDRRHGTRWVQEPKKYEWQRAIRRTSFALYTEPKSTIRLLANATSKKEEELCREIGASLVHVSSNRRAAVGDSPDRGGQRFGNKV